MTEEAVERYPRDLRISFLGDTPVKASIEGVEFVPADRTASVDELVEALNAIIDRAPERDPKWAGMTARDIALFALRSITKTTDDATVAQED